MIEVINRSIVGLLGLIDKSDSEKLAEELAFIENRVQTGNLPDDVRVSYELWIEVVRGMVSKKETELNSEIDESIKDYNKLVEEYNELDELYNELSDEKEELKAKLASLGE